MPGDDEDDDFDYTTTDVTPRDPDRFLKHSDPGAKENRDDPQPREHEIREDE